MINSICDELLFDSIKAGDRNSFTEIYNRYNRQLFTHIFKILKDEEQSWDVLQNVFTTLWKNSSKIQIRVSLKSYLYRMARNFTINEIQKNKNQEKHIESFAKFLDQQQCQIANTINFNELSKCVNYELLNMGPRMREIFIKCRLENISYREVALIMGITENTVKTVLHRATKELRRKLSPFNVNVILLMLFL